jgi:hypothetical protein
LPKTTDIHWLAGLMEGEGSFQWNKSPSIQMSTTDYDVAIRAARIMNVEVTGPYKPRGHAGYKTVWHVRAYSSMAASWMMILFCLLGARRQEQIRSTLAEWNARPNYPKASRGSRLAAECHPRRIRVGFGKCKQCYMKEYRSNHGKSN